MIHYNAGLTGVLYRLRGEQSVLTSMCIAIYCNESTRTFFFIWLEKWFSMVC